ncbi:MAG: hypothetical protein AAF726_08920 [Planctomycetota bacterium]
MSDPHSPWALGSESESPDGRFLAAVSDAGEIAMGAPTSGSLSIVERSSGERRTFDGGFSPSFAWCDDSRRLAIPRWTRSRDQELVVVDAVSGKEFTVAGPFSVLELHAFEGDVIRGVDSPAYQPRPLEVHLVP